MSLVWCWVAGIFVPGLTGNARSIPCVSTSRGAPPLGRRNMAAALGMFREQRTPAAPRVRPVRIPFDRMSLRTRGVEAYGGGKRCQHAIMLADNHR